MAFPNFRTRSIPFTLQSKTDLKGVNPLCPPLMPIEAEYLRQSDVCKKRLQDAYAMMLDFFGMELVDRETGKIGRAPHALKGSENRICVLEGLFFEGQYAFLEAHRHNYLRISRIIICLGELGFQHYQYPFLEFLVYEVFANGVLMSASCSYLPRTLTVHEEQLNQFLDPSPEG